MADKASRGLVLYGDGLASFLLINKNPSQSQSQFCNTTNINLNNYLNSFASRAYCGFLSLPLSPTPSESENKRTVGEFLQLLDACEYASGLGKDNNVEKCETTTLLERFMGMKLALITNNADLKSVGGKLGITVYQLSDLVSDDSSADDMSCNTLSLKLLNMLGFQEGNALETSPFDLVFVHIGDTKTNGDENIKFFDNSVGALMHLADQGSEIGDRLHMSVVMSFGSMLRDEDPTFSVLENKYANNSVFPMLFPRQSYTMKGSSIRHNVRHHCPMLLAQCKMVSLARIWRRLSHSKILKREGEC